MKNFASSCFLLLTVIVSRAAAQSGVEDRTMAADRFSQISVASSASDSLSFGSVEPVVPEFRLAIRSNLLADIVLMPNIGVEIPLGDRFSLGGDFIFAYWRLNDRYAIQTIQGNLECRYWFGAAESSRRFRRDGRLTGWNAGLYGTFGGRYDVQWNQGWQGDRFWTAGLTGGYSTAVSRSLNLDFSLAAGFFFTPEARHYAPPQEGHLIWKETRYNMGRFSLTRARVSLVWLIHRRSNR